VLSHVLAVQATGAGLASVDADPTDPAAVLADPALTSVIDLGQPAAVILAAVLHFTDAGEARAITAGYMERLAAGSYAVITVAHYDDEALNERITAMYTAGRWHNHSRAHVKSFFAGMELIPPGVAAARGWRPGWREALPPAGPAYVLAGIGVRP
jgi:hypothetical protein